MLHTLLASLSAGHYRKEHGFQMEVLRLLSHWKWKWLQIHLGNCLNDISCTLGLFCPRKGTDVLAAALPIAWQQEPELNMVWQGNQWNGAVENYRDIWGEQASQVRMARLCSKASVVCGSETSRGRS